MEILKGIVRDEGYPDVECMYGKVDENTVYYFVMELPNGNVVASVNLKEAIGHAPHTSLGMINKNGDVLIPFENKLMKQVKGELLLVEKNVPTSPEVVENLNKKADPLNTSVLAETANVIKSQMNTAMGMSGNFVFENQFSEAALYTFDGANISGSYSSFISEINGVYYFSTCVNDGQIIKYDPEAVAMAENTEMPSDEAPITNENLNDNVDVNDTNVESDVSLNMGAEVSVEAQNDVDLSEEIQNDVGETTSSDSLENDNVPENVAKDNGNDEFDSFDMGDISDNTSDSNNENESEDTDDFEFEDDSIEGNVSDDADDSEYSDDIDNSNESDDIDDSEYSDDVDNANESDDIDDSEYSDDVDNANESDDIDDSEYSDDVDNANESDDIDDSEYSDDVDNVNESDDIDEPDNRDSINKNDNKLSLEEMKCPTIADATETIKRLMEENAKLRRENDKQYSEIQILESQKEILETTNMSHESEINQLRQDVKNAKQESHKLTLDNNRIKSTLERQSALMKEIYEQNDSLRVQVAGLTALRRAVDAAGCLIETEQSNEDSNFNEYNDSMIRYGDFTNDDYQKKRIA